MRVLKSYLMVVPIVILSTNGCKFQPKIDSTPVGIELEYVGSEVDLNFCSKFYEGYRPIEVEIMVERYEGPNNPVANYKTYFFERDNDMNNSNNRIFRNIEVPKAGPFAVVVWIRQNCSTCCNKIVGNKGCPFPQRGRPRFRGTSPVYDYEKGNPPPAKILITEELITCVVCNC